jgi:hypothetical protein
MQVEHEGTLPSHCQIISEVDNTPDFSLRTLLFLFLHGIHAEDTALRLPPFTSPLLSSFAVGSSLGRIGRGAMAQPTLLLRYVKTCAPSMFE